MTQEEMMRMMQQQMGGQQQPSFILPVDKIDLFIDKCCKEHDETLLSFGQALQWKLQQAPMISFPELEGYPQILQRINERLQKGEN